MDRGRGNSGHVTLPNKSDQTSWTFVYQYITASRKMCVEIRQLNVVLCNFNVRIQLFNYTDPKKIPKPKYNKQTEVEKYNNILLTIYKPGISFTITY